MSEDSQEDLKIDEPAEEKKTEFKDVIEKKFIGGIVKFLDQVVPKVEKEVEKVLNLIDGIDTKADPEATKA